MFHLTGFYASVDQAAAYTAMAAIVPEPVIFVSGNDIRVPGATDRDPALPFVVAAAAGLSSGGNMVARLTAPSLRSITRFFINPINGGADADVTPLSPQAVLDLRASPLQLVPPEILDCDTHADPSLARKQWVLVWLADGPIQEISAQKIYTARATGTTTLTVGQWTAVPITFDDSLPVGNLQVVGLRARSAGIIAARFVFIGQTYRPGVLGSVLQKDVHHPMFRTGRMGMFGHFNPDTIPQIEVLSTSADTAEVFDVDIIAG